MAGAHHARALLHSAERPGDGGAAARRIAALVLQTHQQAEVRMGRGSCLLCAADTSL